MKLKKFISLLVFSVLVYFIINAIRIYKFSFEYSEQKSDVAIVLGAGINGDIPSPVFRERINHSVYLYKKGIVSKIIYTGGQGKGQTQFESVVAKKYAIEKGVNEGDIFIEKKSKYTVENLSEAKQIMDSLEFKTVLLISDPFHMRRAALLANKNKLNFKTSPTQTSMYKSKIPRFIQLMYECFFFSIREPITRISF
ncbi:YdcF family protein [Brumimicrobium aurantiacum]|uniref:YdcF family protein n=1 Tax=Brumimicrobium aurantiacum TaxID=1737063 RepID=A0A3E1EVN9_9FLAO|nr:YdcF family protein [Brumimicrobium aurantiacum]RFC53625.1 YdcF family protein [Brumimicrobium aurantiacum]